MVSTGPRRQRAKVWTQQVSAGAYGLSDLRPFQADFQHFRKATGLIVSFHEGLEVGVMLEGSSDLELDGSITSNMPGDVWFVGTWEPHRWRVSEDGTSFVSLLFLPDFMPDEILPGGGWQGMFTCPPDRRPKAANCETRDTVLALGWEMAHETEAKRDGWRTAMRLALAKLLFTVSREWRPSPAASPKRHPQPTGVRRISPALTAIHSRPVERVTLSHAADLCGLSTAQFSRLFVQTMGISFGRFRMRAHLAFAAHLLLTTDLGIDAIAAESGFTDGSHLHRNFSRDFGVTPGEYRRQNR